jgi:hypothetical protein
LDGIDARNALDVEDFIMYRARPLPARGRGQLSRAWLHIPCTEMYQVCPLVSGRRQHPRGGGLLLLLAGL